MLFKNFVEDVIPNQSMFFAFFLSTIKKFKSVIKKGKSCMEI